MEVLVTALHAKGEWQLKASNCTIKEVEQGNRYVVIGSIGTEVDEPEEALEQAFFYFNWQSIQHSGSAPSNVNLIARFNESHASMSIGDVVKVQYMKWSMRQAKVVTKYWQCAPQGWSVITDE